METPSQNGTNGEVKLRQTGSTHLIDGTVTQESVSNVSFVTDTRPLRGQQETAGLRTGTGSVTPTALSSGRTCGSEVQLETSGPHPEVAASAGRNTLVNGLTGVSVPLVAGLTGTVALDTQRQGSGSGLLLFRSLGTLVHKTGWNICFPLQV